MQYHMFMSVIEHDDLDIFTCGQMICILQENSELFNAKIISFLVNVRTTLLECHF
jgi:hypothetical protein